MRIANLGGRLVILVSQGAIDVERSSDGRFASDPQAVYAVWDKFRTWADGVEVEGAVPFDPTDLGPAVPRPPQVFAIGLNYADHARESGLTPPPEPAVFTKFVSSFAGPHSDIPVPAATVDWEVELVVVIGREARQVLAADAWSYVAGLTVGQDISERTRQLVQPAPQFSLAKSFPGFSPIGPAVVTIDELENPDDLGLGCSIDSEQMQKGRTSDLIFTVPVLIERLSEVLTLLPGDVIFTGTPAGVGGGRDPKRFLAPGETLHSWIDGVGELTNRLTVGPAYITRTS